MLLFSTRTKLSDIFYNERGYDKGELIVSCEKRFSVAKKCITNVQMLSYIVFYIPSVFRLKGIWATVLRLGEMRMWRIVGWKNNCSISHQRCLPVFSALQKGVNALWVM
jgi:hypothetical protein